MTLLVLAGCAAHSPVDRAQVSERLRERSGQEVGERAPGNALLLPPGIEIADDLTEDEAVAIALWNNAAFHAELATSVLPAPMFLMPALYSALRPAARPPGCHPGGVLSAGGGRAFPRPLQRWPAAVKVDGG